MEEIFVVFEYHVTQATAGTKNELPDRISSIPIESFWTEEEAQRKKRECEENLKKNKIASPLARYDVQRIPLPSQSGAKKG
jgi:hypothetical protein